MKRPLSTAIFIFAFLASLASTGCAGRAAARDSARRLAASVQLYQQHLDGVIEKQKIHSDSRQKAQLKSRQEIREGRLRDLRISLGSQAAEKMITNPQSEARPSRLTAFLLDAYQNAISLDAKLIAQEQEEVKGLQERMSVLQSKKEIAQKIQLNLTKLAANSSVAEETAELKEYGAAVKKEIDQLNAENQKAKQAAAATENTEKK
jgi:hypothetical protein